MQAKRKLQEASKSKKIPEMVTGIPVRRPSMQATPYPQRTIEVREQGKKFEKRERGL